MNDPFKTHGAFSWFELQTSDVEAAKSFYTRLFGWKTEDNPMEGMDYTVIKIGDDGVGGIMKTPAEAAGVPPHWGGFVTVDNVDSVAQKAEELGATILVPLTDIPSVGRFFVFQDPQGAVLSAITYSEE